jgi:hypothetical protein
MEWKQVREAALKLPKGMGTNQTGVAEGADKDEDEEYRCGRLRRSTEQQNGTQQLETAATKYGGRLLNCALVLGLASCRICLPDN